MRFPLINFNFVIILVFIVFYLAISNIPQACWRYAKSIAPVARNTVNAMQKAAFMWNSST